MAEKKGYDMDGFHPVFQKRKSEAKNKEVWLWIEDSVSWERRGESIRRNPIRTMVHNIESSK